MQQQAGTDDKHNFLEPHGGESGELFPLVDSLIYKPPARENLKLENACGNNEKGK